MRLGRRTAFAAAGVALTLLAPSADRLHAQGTISGRVTAAGTNEPLADAHVIVVGANAFTITGRDGRYTLRNVQAADVDVQVLRVGYEALKKRATVTTGATVTLDFQLGRAIVQLQEVVTTATGQQRRVELGNAVSTFGDVGKRVEEGAVNSLADVLVAKAPGVIVLPAVMTGGAPTVRIRGLSSISLTNAPIYVVDGIRYESGTVSANGGQTSYSLLNNLNPNEIEDIEIVKGPSAATLYGTNASNGVVVITTKRGRAGRTQWNFYGETGQVKDWNPYQTMYANWGHAPGSATPIRCKIATMGPTTCISDSLTSYNLLKDKDRTFIHDGNRHMVGAQVSGGNEAVRFFVSAEGEREIAPIKMPGFEVARFEAQKIPVRGEWLRPEAGDKLSFRANLNAALSPKLDISVNTGFGSTYNRVPPSGSAFEALVYVGMMNYGFKGPGLDKVPTSANGTPLMDYLQYAPGDIMQRYRPVSVQRTTGSVNANWRPLPWLQNDMTVGVDLANRDRSDLCRLNECAPVGTDRQGRINDNKANNRSFTAKAMSTAAWNARPWLNLKTTVGADYVNQEFDSTSSGGTGLPPGAQNVANAATPTGVGAAWPTATKTLGLYVQEQFSFNDRLFITGAFRSDQNSAFGTKFGNVLYPKASLSWIASDESFFPRWSFINQFRLRTSFGASGVQPGRTDGLVTFTPGAQNLVVNRGTTTGVDVPGLAANQTGNPELRPETSKEYEVGFETQLFRSRVSLDYTYFDKRTKDALIRVDKAPSSAAADLSPLENIGSTKDWGHELVLTTQVLDTRRFGWDVTINASHISNKVLDLGIDPVSGKSRVLNPGSNTRQVVGYPINSRWYRGYSYSDANGDGILQISEVQVDTAFAYEGYSFPRDNVGITSGFDLFSRVLRINVFFDHRGGFLLQDGGNNFQCNAAPFACRETQDPTAPLYLQARNIAKTYGTTINGTSYKTTVGYLSSGAFWRFRELSAAYTLPNAVVNRLRAQSGSTLVFAMRNIATWTSYDGVDPEEHDTPSDVQSNFQSVPPRTYLTLRLNLKF